MDDLQKIGQKTELATHITTLTRTCAGFSVVQNVNFLDQVLPELPVADRERLYTSYLECSNWQREGIECESTLASHLRAFPKLRNIRIDALDKPKNLGEWLCGGGFL